MKIQYKFWTTNIIKGEPPYKFKQNVQIMSLKFVTLNLNEIRTPLDSIETL